MTGTNATRDPDSVLAAWLDEGPTDLPDATRRAILTALPTTSQARRGLLAPWRFTQMNMFARGAAVLVVAVVAIGALALLAGGRVGIGGPSPSAIPSPTPPASAPPLPSLDATFVSRSYGYQVRYPSGWTVGFGAAPWTVGRTISPGDPIADGIVTPTGLYRMRISAASLALPKGMTIDTFRAFASPFSAPFNNDPCPPLAPLPVPLMLDDQASPGATPHKVQAVVSINGCAALAELGGSIYDIEVIAGGRGYEFLLDGQMTVADALEWLATVELQPARVPTSSAAPSPAASK
jgi:hypothetical protein